MKVMKFGGTSIGKPERMKQVAELIKNSSEPTIVVLSALNGTTNALEEISIGLASNERKRASVNVAKLEAYYREFINELINTESGMEKAELIIAEHFEFLNIILKISYSLALQKDILAQGELLSTKIFSIYLDESGIEHELLPALDFMQIDNDGEPLIGNIRVKLSQILKEKKNKKLFITQGYICRNHLGEVDNLKRGGSDYSASLIAAGIDASVCEIWTDIDGMQNNDPRVVKATIPIEQLSFEEAAELAYFGAKILHPSSIWPARHYKIPVRLLNTMQPEANGTLVTMDAGSVGVKAIAAKDGIIAINILSSRMLLAYGFLRKVFDIFESYKTSIDMVTTSEVAVSVTIDSKEHLEDIRRDLDSFGKVEVEEDHTIVSIVGNEILQTPHLIKLIFESIHDIPVSMVSYGGSKHNISLLIKSEFKVATMKALNKGLFGLE